jgi:hypothetical protein
MRNTRYKMDYGNLTKGELESRLWEMQVQENIVRYLENVCKPEEFINKYIKFTTDDFFMDREFYVFVKSWRWVHSMSESYVLFIGPSIIRKYEDQTGRNRTTYSFCDNDEIAIRKKPQVITEEEFLNNQGWFINQIKEFTK